MTVPHSNPPCAATPQSPVGSPALTPPAPADILNSHALLQGRRTIAIQHNGAVYHLQATRQGKLILTK